MCLPVKLFPGSSAWDSNPNADNAVYELKEEQHVAAVL